MKERRRQQHCKQYTKILQRGELSRMNAVFWAPVYCSFFKKKKCFPVPWYNGDEENKQVKPKLLLFVKKHEYIYMFQKEKVICSHSNTLEKCNSWDGSWENRKGRRHKNIVTQIMTSFQSVKLFVSGIWKRNSFTPVNLFFASKQQFPFSFRR